MSWTNEAVEKGERSDTFGKAPYGFLAYSPDGRMSAIIVREKRPRPTDPGTLTDPERVELFKSMIAYAGTFKVEGDRVLHNVDISWNENWTGSAQVRHFRIEGRTLIIRTDPGVNPITGKRTFGVLVWEKVQ